MLKFGIKTIISVKSYSWFLAFPWVLDLKNLGLPGDEPGVVWSIFKEGVKLHWWLGENFHVCHDWNRFLWHFPFEILVCYLWFNEVSRIMLCYNLSYNQKQKSNTQQSSPHQTVGNSMIIFFLGELPSEYCKQQSCNQEGCWWNVGAGNIPLPWK